MFAGWWIFLSFFVKQVNNKKSSDSKVCEAGTVRLGKSLFASGKRGKYFSK